MALSAVNVTTSATTIAAANYGRRLLMIQNVSDTDIYLKLDSSATALTHHRLVQKQAGSWMAQGDNNDRVDRSWVTPDNYLGRSTGRHVQLLIP